MVLALLGHAVARAEPVGIPLPDGTVLRAEFVLPSRFATGPAVVALHGCGGPFPARDRQWAEALSRAGHAVLFPDSFGSRGLGSQCGERGRAVTAEGVRRGDALAAARWLAAQPYAPPGGVVLLGWSNGGSAVLAAGRQAPDLPAGLLRGLVAFYPGCRAALRVNWRPAAPMLLLHGEADDWTPISRCRDWAKGNKDVVQLVAYPGAYHDFDAPGMALRTRRAAFSADGSGTVHQGTDPAAREDALRRVPAFLASLPSAR